MGLEFRRDFSCTWANGWCQICRNGCGCSALHVQWEKNQGLNSQQTTAFKTQGKEEKLVLKDSFRIICSDVNIPQGFSDGSDGKESACNEEDLGSVPGLGRLPGGRHGNPHRYSCLENPHGQRSLVGYSLSGCKESDMTEQLSTAEFKQLAIGHTWAVPYHESG